MSTLYKQHKHMVTRT